MPVDASDPACEPAPLVLAWGGRVVPGLTAPLLVDNGKPDFIHTVYNDGRRTSLSDPLSLTATSAKGQP